MAHGNVVRTTLECVSFNQLDTTNFGRLELEDQLVLSVFKAALARHRRHQRFVRGQCNAASTSNESGLRYINPVTAFIEQDEAAVFFVHVLELDERRLDKRAAFGIKGQIKNIGGD